MTDKQPTRDRLVAAAMELFHENGYEATGLKEILERAQANSGSLYYYFKSKEELLVAVLQKYTELMDPIVMRPAFERTADPMERVFAVLAGYRVRLLETEFTRGCPIGNLALEVGDKLSAAREFIALNFANWCKVIQGCLDSAADRFAADVDFAAISRFVLTIMEGGIMQARVHRNVRPFDDAVAMLRDYFRRLQRVGQESSGGVN